MTDARCLCGDARAAHKMGRGSCNVCGQFGCDRYEPMDEPVESLDADLAELEAADPTVRAAGESYDRTVGSIVAKARGDFDLPGGESTSAVLRRLEAERDEALAVQKDAIDAFIRITDRCTLLQAELASARTELDAVRTARDNLDRELNELCERLAAPPVAAAVKDLGEHCEKCEQPIRRGDAYVPPLPGIGLYEHVHCPDLDEVVGAEDGWICLTSPYCDASNGLVFTPGQPPTTDHPCGPLTPVRITVTRRNQGAPTA